MARLAWTRTICVLLAGCTPASHSTYPPTPLGTEDTGAAPQRIDTGAPGTSSEGDTGCFVEPVFVVPGTGADAFIAGVDTRTAQIVHSPGGGWQFWAGAQIGNFHPQVSVLATFTLVASGAIIAGADGPDDIVYTTAVPNPLHPCLSSFYGQRAALWDNSPNGLAWDQEAICSLDGLPVDEVVRVTDLIDGSVGVSGPAHLTLAVDPLDACESVP